MKHYHVPGKPYMSMHDRAGQFMPFKSLKGYDEMVGDISDEVLNQEWVQIDFDDIIE